MCDYLRKIQNSMNHLKILFLISHYFLKINYLIAAINQNLFFKNITKNRDSFDLHPQVILVWHLKKGSYTSLKMVGYGLIVIENYSQILYLFEIKIAAYQR